MSSLREAAGQLHGHEQPAVHPAGRREGRRPVGLDGRAGQGRHGASVDPGPVRDRTGEAGDDGDGEDRRARALFFIGAAAIGLFSLFFFWFMVGEILAIWLPRWPAFTIVFVVMLLMAGALAFLGLRKVKKIKKPERTISTLSESASTLKAAATHTQPAAPPGRCDPPIHTHRSVDVDQRPCDH